MPGTMPNTLLYNSLFNKTGIIESPTLLMKTMGSEKLHNIPKP